MVLLRVVDVCTEWQHLSRSKYSHVAACTSPVCDTPMGGLHSTETETFQAQWHIGMIGPYLLRDWKINKSTPEGNIHYLFVVLCVWAGVCVVIFI